MVVKHWNNNGALSLGIELYLIGKEAHCLLFQFIKQDCQQMVQPSWSQVVVQPVKKRFIETNKRILKSMSCKRPFQVGSWPMSVFSSCSSIILKVKDTQVHKIMAFVMQMIRLGNPPTSIFFAKHIEGSHFNYCPRNCKLYLSISSASQHQSLTNHSLD